MTPSPPDPSQPPSGEPEPEQKAQEASDSEQVPAPSADTARQGRVGPFFRWTWGIAWPLALGLLLVALFSAWRAPDLPEQAPAFTLADLDGAEVDLTALRGGPVVLNFWATWCGPCRFEVPQLSGFADANPDIPVIGLALDGTEAQLRRAGEDLGIRYPIVPLDDQTKEAYSVQGVPMTVIVGPEGEVWSTYVGMISRPQLWLMTRAWWPGH